MFLAVVWVLKEVGSLFFTVWNETHKTQSKVQQNFNYYVSIFRFKSLLFENVLSGIIIIANPYSEDTTKKFNSMELLVPRTGTIHHLCKLPQSLYMPGMHCHVTILH